MLSIASIMARWNTRCYGDNRRCDRNGRQITSSIAAWAIWVKIDCRRVIRASPASVICWNIIWAVLWSSIFRNIFWAAPPASNLRRVMWSSRLIMWSGGIKRRCRVGRIVRHGKTRAFERSGEGSCAWAGNNICFSGGFVRIDTGLAVSLVALLQRTGAGDCKDKGKCPTQISERHHLRVDVMRDKKGNKEWTTLRSTVQKKDNKRLISLASAEVMLKIFMPDSSRQWADISDSDSCSILLKRYSSFLVTAVEMESVKGWQPQRLLKAEQVLYIQNSRVRKLVSVKQYALTYSGDAEVSMVCQSRASVRPDRYLAVLRWCRTFASSWLLAATGVDRKELNTAEQKAEIGIRSPASRVPTSQASLSRSNSD